MSTSANTGQPTLAGSQDDGVSSELSAPDQILETSTGDEELPETKEDVGDNYASALQDGGAKNQMYSWRGATSMRTHRGQLHQTPIPVPTGTRLELDDIPTPRESRPLLWKGKTKGGGGKYSSTDDRVRRGNDDKAGSEEEEEVVPEDSPHGSKYDIISYFFGED